jgi:hypothetical protein
MMTEAEIIEQARLDEEANQAWLAANPKYKVQRDHRGNVERVVSRSGESIPVGGTHPLYLDYLEHIAEGGEVGEIPGIPAPEPMGVLRGERDRLLAKTDKPWGSADYQHPNKQAWLDYRQALRDLPATADPQLDENDQLTNVTWPTPPE